jgi:hypothetical protein
MGTDSDLVMADPITGEIRKRAHSVYLNVSGVLATAGGLVFTGFADGSLVAYNDTGLDQVWKINVGTGFNAPPMTFEAGGKQYVAILAGLSWQSKALRTLTPELRLLVITHRVQLGLLAQFLAKRDAVPEFHLSSIDDEMRRVAGYRGNAAAFRSAQAAARKNWGAPIQSSWLESTE